jgi:Skp family chaperone for outer membrane proteins
MTRGTAVLVFGILLAATSSSAQTLGASFLQGPTTVQQAPPAPPAMVPSILRPAAPTFPPDVKLGFINLQTIAQESTSGKVASVQLKRLQDLKLTEIQAKTQAVKALQDKQSSSTILSATAAAQLQKDLERAQMDLQYAQQMAQKEVDDLQRDLMSAFSEKVTPVVEQVRAERGLWAIWTIDESLAALMPGLDLSLEVVKRLDAQK